MGELHSIATARIARAARIADDLITDCAEALNLLEEDLGTFCEGGILSGTISDLAYADVQTSVERFLDLCAELVVELLKLPEPGESIGMIERAHWQAIFIYCLIAHAKHAVEPRLRRGALALTLNAFEKIEKTLGGLKLPKV